ncbi:P-loop containing nucleoside triphosphate hydrolase protein, partial [Trametes cingulata]
MSPTRPPKQGVPTWTPRPNSRHAYTPRPRLTPEDVRTLAAKMREVFKWDSDPRDFQLEGVRAQIEGQDIIIQAPTGAGKTALAAGPHVWPGNEKKFTLMVCPLLSLEEEMVQTFKTDFGLDAIAINSKNGACSPLVIRDILAMKYQIILLSPEMLQSRTFMNRILRNSSFMRNIISMFIDEAHCIAHWGADFRKKYGSLGKIRAFLPRGTPVIAVTATLTVRVRRTIHSVLLFSQSAAQSRFVNKGNDRSNVSIVVRACEHPLNTYADLDFVIPGPEKLKRASDIPKTYIYVDNIATGAEIIDYLIEKLEVHMSRSPSSRIPLGIIRPFNATLSHEYRGLAMMHFRSGSIRILVCTDAAGMGCNIPDIDRVIQWKLPATMSNFIQRAGRAARGKNRTGVAVLLVEKS